MTFFPFASITASAVSGKTGDLPSATTLPLLTATLASTNPPGVHTSPPAMRKSTLSTKKKTGIEVDYWRASATKVMDRALSESRAGKPLFDIILTNDNPMQIMFKEGLFAKYDSPSAKDFTKESIDPNLGPRYRNVVIGVVYNKDVIKPADASKSLEDLVKL